MEQSFLVVTELLQKIASHPECVFFWDTDSRLGLESAGICRLVAEAMIRRAPVRELLPHLAGERWLAVLREAGVPELHVTITACATTKVISVVAVDVVVAEASLAGSAA
jgi:hypothetical protein